MARTSRDEGDGLCRIYIRPMLLLQLAGGPSHGYDLLDQVRGAGVRSADAGGLYRALRTMEQEGLVSSWWETSPNGPPRRTYTLTPEGVATLERSVASLREVHRLVAGMLERHDSLAPSTSSEMVPAGAARR